MRRLALATLLLSGSGLACVSVHPASSGTPPYPIYKIQPPAKMVERPVARRARPTPQHTTVSAWLPRSRRISRRWTHVVLHHSATAIGGAQRFDKFHRQTNGWDELGYHFVIGNGTDTRDGLVEVGPRWHKQKHGAHCKTPNNYFNEHGIGICLVGDFTKGRPTPRQLASLERLLRFLGAQCRIPPQRVTTHGAIKRSTQCPGQNFRLATVRRRMANPPTATVLP